MPGECFKVSNNKYFNCPALMADARTFTDYRPSCVIDQGILKNKNIRSSYEYRQFLIQNASKFMQENNDMNYNKNGCETCNAEPIPLKTVCPYDTILLFFRITQPTEGFNPVKFLRFFAKLIARFIKYLSFE